MKRSLQRALHDENRSFFPRPAFECQGSLMQQHAKTVQSRQTFLPSFLQKARAAVINQIDRERVRASAVQRQGIRIARPQTHRCPLNHPCGLAELSRSLPHIPHPPFAIRKKPAQSPLKRESLACRSVHDSRTADAFLRERHENRSSRAARTQENSERTLEALLKSAERAPKTQAVGGISHQTVLFPHDRIHRPRPRRLHVQFIQVGQNLFFIRHGDIASQNIRRFPQNFEKRG